MILYYIWKENKREKAGKGDSPKEITFIFHLSSKVLNFSKYSFEEILRNLSSTGLKDNIVCHLRQGAKDLYKLFNLNSWCLAVHFTILAVFHMFDNFVTKS